MFCSQQWILFSASLVSCWLCIIRTPCSLKFGLQNTLSYKVPKKCATGPKVLRDLLCDLDMYIGCVVQFSFLRALNILRLRSYRFADLGCLFTQFLCVSNRAKVIMIIIPPKCPWPFGSSTGISEGWCCCCFTGKPNCCLVFGVAQFMNRTLHKEQLPLQLSVVLVVTGHFEAVVTAVPCFIP